MSDWSSDVCSSDLLVNYCFHNDEDDEFGTDWLISNYATVYYEYQVDIAPLNKITKNNTYISDSVLEKYKQYHPYMWQRKLTKDVVDCFEVGYDPQYNVITFPVRDEKGHLLGITARSVLNKFYHIPPELTKPVYLLYYILQHNITNVVVVESQINALTLWSYNIPAVALFGTGTPEQLDTLMKCGITYYLLAFDGDDAGRKGALRFINAFKQRPDIIIDVLILPQGKDVNDLSKEELDTLPSMDSVSYERFINK